MNHYKLVFCAEGVKITLQVQAKNQAEALKELSEKLEYTFNEYFCAIYFIGKVN